MRGSNFSFHGPLKMQSGMVLKTGQKRTKVWVVKGFNISNYRTPKITITASREGLQCGKICCTGIVQFLIFEVLSSL